MIKVLLIVLQILVCIIALDILLHLLFWLCALITSLTITKEEYTKPSKFYTKFLVFSYKYLIHVARVKVHVTGYEKVDFDKKFMLVSNHRSKFDNFIHCAFLDKANLAYISKPENFKIPMAGKLMKRCLYLPIQRGNPREGLKTILKAVDYIKNDLTCIGVFPEGTRSKDGNLLEFKPGCFKISEKSASPIVVCCMQGTENISKNWPWKKTDVYFDILEVIEPSVWQDKKTVDVAQYTHDLILNNINKENK